MSAEVAESGAATRSSLLRVPRAIFIRVGVLPFFLLAAIIIFAILSPRFLTLQNIGNVTRQSVYLVLVSLGQMLALVTGGFDLSVGTTIAVTSVVSALAMTALAVLMPEAVFLAIALGCLAGLAAGLAIGAVNGVGVAYFDVSPFIMTLGVSSVGAGLALFLTGGVPVAGLPFAFADTLGFGRLWGFPVPLLVGLLSALLLWIAVTRTPFGTRLYAVGGNIRAAQLSAINTRGTLMAAYVLCALLASLSGLLLTARVESGEANLGGTITLESIAACVIAGVSLRGGIGRVENVVLGAFFIVLVQNGMNLTQVSSYMQMVLLGLLLIIAVILDRVRTRMLLGAR
jgi:ribose transport system permease protein